MTWFKIDDSFYDHPKVKRIPKSTRKGAIALWTMAGSWCCRYLQDGIVPATMIEELGYTLKEAQALVDCALWESGPDCYVFHDWAHYQFTREQVEAERAAARERMMNRRRNRAVGSQSVRPNADGTSGEVREMFGGGS